MKLAFHVNTLQKKESTVRDSRLIEVILRFVRLGIDLGIVPDICHLKSVGSAALRVVAVNVGSATHI